MSAAGTLAPVIGLAALGVAVLVGRPGVPRPGRAGTYGAPPRGSVPGRPPARPSRALPWSGGPARPRRSSAGAARWARRSDLRSLVLRDRRRSGSGPRVVLGTSAPGRRPVAAEAGQSVLVFGPSQSGKTSAVAVPAILEWPGPVVAASVKADLLQHTVDRRRAVGEVGIFDPSGVTGLASVGWSPLPASRTWPGARRVATRLTEVARSTTGSMTDGDFWYATAARALGPLLFAAASGGRTLDDVVRWVATEEEDEVLALLGATGVTEAVDAARSAFGKEPRQRSSVTTTLEAVLEPFVDGRLTGHGGADPGAVDAARLLAGANTLFLCAPAHDQRRLGPLFASVVHEVVDHVYDRVTATRRPLERPLLVVLDEAANLAPLPDLDVLVSTAAGHGIVLVTAWHDLAQLNARYGPRATTVVNNHRARLFLPGIADLATLDYASQLVGEEEVDLPSVTTGHGPSSTTRSPGRRPLAPPGRPAADTTGRGTAGLRQPAPGPPAAPPLVRRSPAAPPGRGGRIGGPVRRRVNAGWTPDSRRGGRRVGYGREHGCGGEPTGGVPVEEGVMPGLDRRATDRLRALCLALPETEERSFGGHTAPAFRVRDKLFVMVAESRETLTLKAAPGEQAVLIGSDPDRYFLPKYVGTKGWVGVVLDDDLDWGELAELVEESYRQIAPKRLVARLEAGTRSTDGVAEAGVGEDGAR